jgi:hypothetical protein
VQSVLDHRNSPQKVWVSVSWELLARLREERYGILILLLIQSLETLAHYHVEGGAGVQLLDCVAFDIIFQGFIIFVCDEVAVSTIQVDQWSDVVLLCHLRCGLDLIDKG